MRHANLKSGLGSTPRRELPHRHGIQFSLTTADDNESKGDNILVKEFQCAVDTCEATHGLLTARKRPLLIELPNTHTHLSSPLEARLRRCLDGPGRTRGGFF